MLRLQLNFLRLPFMSEMRNKLILFKARKKRVVYFLAHDFNFDFLAIWFYVSFNIAFFRDNYESLDTYSPRNSQILFNCPVMFPFFYNSAFSLLELHGPFWALRSNFEITKWSFLSTRFAVSR